jgi:hypothetical protein
MDNKPCCFRDLARDNTERRGQVVNTHASYSGGPVFISRPETSYPNLQVNNLIRPRPLLPHLLNFIIHLSPSHSMLYNLRY